MIYFLSSVGVATSVSFNGTHFSHVWSYDTRSDETNICTPAIDSEGNTYFYADNLYAFDRSGALMWQFPIPGVTSPSYDSSPAIGGATGSVVYFCDMYFLYAVTSAGELLWNFSAVDLRSAAPAINNDGNVVISGQQHVYTVNGTDGSILWATEFGNYFLSEVSLSDSGAIYVGTAQNVLFAIDAAAGNILWNYTTQGFLSGRIAVSATGDLVVADSTSTLYRLTSLGVLVWLYNAPTGGGMCDSFALGADGVVYFAHSNIAYALTESGDELWTISLGSEALSPPAIGSDGTVYYGQNGQLYAINIAFTSAPSAVPTSFPSAVCPGGEIEGSRSEQKCHDCEEGEFSDGVKCISCASGRTNEGSGNSDCGFYISTISIKIVYVVAAAFLVCSLMSYFLSLSHGGPWFAILGVLLVVGDQITDMLFAIRAQFYTYYLLQISGIFCIVPLLPFAYIILTRSSCAQWRCVDSVVRMHQKLCSWHSDSFGWLFHSLSVHNLQWNFFPSIIVMLLGNIVWPFARIIFMSCFTVIHILLQVVYLIMGVLFHATKLVTHRKTNELYWWLWCCEGNDEEVISAKNDLETKLNVETLPSNGDLQCNVIDKRSMELIPLTNSIILMEVFFESIPQLTIQLINNCLIFGSSLWSTIAIVSTAFSVFKIVTVVYHFGYYMIISESRSFMDVPKFELFVRGDAASPVPASPTAPVEAAVRNSV